MVLINVQLVELFVSNGATAIITKKRFVKSVYILSFNLIKQFLEYVAGLKFLFGKRLFKTFLRASHHMMQN